MRDGFPSVRFVGRDQLDNLALARAGCKEFSLDCSNPSTNLEHSSAIEVFVKDTPHHLAFDRAKPFLSVSLQVLARSLRLEDLLTGLGATALCHDGMIPRSTSRVRISES